ncbi:MAG: hypothetical protein ACRD22_22010 [Terriglobia bacterium]
MVAHWGMVELVSGGNLIALLLILWRISAAVASMERIVRDFPPHRHIEDSIIYPVGYEPPREVKSHK